MPDQNPKIELCDKSGKTCLKFTFKGELTERDAINAIDEWQTAFNSIPQEKITLIWDCLEMTSYESEARILWQDAIKRMKKQIDTIWLISDSNIIKLGARIISIMTSLQISAVDSESKIIL